MSDGHDTGIAARQAWAFAAMAGSVLGAGLQLQQPALWPVAVYACAGAVSLLGLWLLGQQRQRVGRASWPLALMLGALMGFALAGARAAVHAEGALDPALEGRDLQVLGVVAQMPQRSEGVLRFRLEVESARWAGQPQDAEPRELRRWPATISLGWYAENTGLWGRPVPSATQLDKPPETPRPPAALHAGERWRMTVRLKAPHGNLNPHGFDQELWLWEQGVQATGYVRTGARDAAPERIGSTWQHPVERAREAVRDAVFERVADRRLAGVIAALVTGDQSAIDRADWDIFRATGVAHLMSISGLHITMCEPF